MSSRLILRLTAPLAAVSLLLLGVGVGAAWYVQRMQRSVSETLLVNVSSMRAAEEVEILIREVRTQFDHFLITGERQAPALDRVRDDHARPVPALLRFLERREKAKRLGGAGWRASEPVRSIADGQHDEVDAAGAAVRMWCDHRSPIPRPAGDGRSRQRFAVASQQGA